MADDAAAPDGELSEETPEVDDAADGDAPRRRDHGRGGRRTERVGRRLPRPRCRMFGSPRFSGWLPWSRWQACVGGWASATYESHKTADERNLFLQVGRQAALNLTTIDFEHADEDVQRVLDSSTGTFYDDFQARAQPFKEVVKQAKSKSVGTIAEAGVESMTADGAEVLVAVTVKTSNAGAAEQDPRAWRMRITVQKVDDEAKVANVRFVS